MPGSPTLSRSVLHLSPPLAAAKSASFAGLRPSNTGSGTRRSPLPSASPPSLRIAISERRCWVAPRRPVAPSMMMPIVRVVMPRILSLIGARVGVLARPIDRREPGRIERLQVDRMRGAIDDQLGHCLGGRRGVENAPNAMAGRDIGAGDPCDAADERQTIAGDRAVARLPCEDLRRGEHRRYRPAYRFEPPDCAWMRGDSSGIERHRLLARN